MKLLTIVGLIVGLCAILQDAEASRRWGGGKHMDPPEPPQHQSMRERRSAPKMSPYEQPSGDAPQAMEDAPEKPFRFRRAVEQMRGFAQPPPPPEEAPQRAEDAPQQPFRARRSVIMADEPEPPKMEEVPQQTLRVRRQMPSPPDMPNPPEGMPRPPFLPNGKF